MTGLENVPPMHYDVSGSGQPLVLLPGGLTGWLSWIPHAEVLAEQYQVVRLQLPAQAFGLAGEPLPENYSIEYEIAALTNRLDALDIPEADVVGWSHGGVVALSYSIRNPLRVRSLTLIEPPAFWILQIRGELSSELRNEHEKLLSFAVADVNEEQLIDFLHFSGLVSLDEDPRAHPTWPIWFENRQSLRASHLTFEHSDDIERLRAFDRPVLLVKGEGSNVGLHAVIDLLAEELPQAELANFPGGHAPHIVSMQSFLTRLMEFLQT